MKISEGETAEHIRIQKIQEANLRRDYQRPRLRLQAVVEQEEV